MKKHDTHVIGYDYGVSLEAYRELRHSAQIHIGAIGLNGFIDSDDFLAEINTVKVDRLGEPNVLYPPVRPEQVAGQLELEYR